MTKRELIEALEILDASDDLQVYFMGYSIVSVEVAYNYEEPHIDLNDLNSLS